MVPTDQNIYSLQNSVIIIQFKNQLSIHLFMQTMDIIQDIHLQFQTIQIFLELMNLQKIFQIYLKHLMKIYKKQVRSNNNLQINIDLKHQILNLVIKYG